VYLGAAANFVVHATSGVSSTLKAIGVSTVVGNVGVHGTATLITDFELEAVMTAKAAPNPVGVDDSYTTSVQITGRVYAMDFTTPAGFTMASVELDKRAAYFDAFNRVRMSADPDNEENLYWRNQGNLNIKTGLLVNVVLTAGVYTWDTATSVTVGNDDGALTLKGDECSVFIFQLKGKQNLLVYKDVQFQGNVQPENVYWVVNGQVVIGKVQRSPLMKGTILSLGIISFAYNGKLLGRALSLTTVTLIHAKINSMDELKGMQRRNPPTMATLSPTAAPTAAPTVTTAAPTTALSAASPQALGAGSTITQEFLGSAAPTKSAALFPVLEVVIAVLGFLVLAFGAGFCYQRKMRHAIGKTLVDPSKKEKASPVQLSRVATAPSPAYQSAARNQARRASLDAQSAANLAKSPAKDEDHDEDRKSFEAWNPKRHGTLNKLPASRGHSDSK
jgi:hypothetical protein